MAIKRVSRSFKDISLSFEPHPITKDLSILKDERAIIRSIRNIVETIPTERYFDPDFGSEVRSSLFDNVDFAVVGVMRDSIINSIENYELRVTNVQVDISPEFDNNSLEVTVIFDIIGQDLPTQEYTFILEATR